MKRAVYVPVAACVAVLAIYVWGHTTIHFSFDDAPRISHHAPAMASQPVPIEPYTHGMSGSAISGSSTRLDDQRRYKISITNASPVVKRWEHVYEGHDHRGKLVRRHTIGPLEVPPWSLRTFRDTLQVPDSERWYVKSETSVTRVLDRT